MIRTGMTHPVVSVRIAGATVEVQARLHWKYAAEEPMIHDRY